jgi:hypothetical protein
MPASARLVVRHGSSQNQEFPLLLSTNIVGREPINDVVFPDPEISRRHARIVSQVNNFYIEDLGSTNGTYVNGRRINSVTRMTFVVEAAEEETPPTPQAVESTPAPAVHSNDVPTPGEIPQSLDQALDDLEVVKTTALPAFDQKNDPLADPTAALKMYALVGLVAFLILLVVCAALFFAFNTLFS